MNVLVINCGSSSLKYQLIDSETEAVFARGSVSTEDLFTRKLAMTKRSQRPPCLLTKRLSRWYWMH